MYNKKKLYSHFLSLKSKAILFKEINTEKRSIYFWMRKISVRLIRVCRNVAFDEESFIHVWYFVAFIAMKWKHHQTKNDWEKEKEWENKLDKWAATSYDWFLFWVFGIYIQHVKWIQEIKDLMWNCVELDTCVKHFSLVNQRKRKMYIKQTKSNETNKMCMVNKNDELIECGDKIF